MSKKNRRTAASRRQTGLGGHQPGEDSVLTAEKAAAVVMFSRALHYWSGLGYPSAEALKQGGSGRPGCMALRGLLAYCGIWEPASPERAHSIWRDAASNGDPFSASIDDFITSRDSQEMLAAVESMGKTTCSGPTEPYWAAAELGDPFALRHILTSVASPADPRAFVDDSPRWDRLMGGAHPDQIADAASYALHVLKRGIIQEKDIPEAAGMLISTIHDAVMRGSSLGYLAMAQEWAQIDPEGSRSGVWMRRGLEAGSVHCRAAQIQQAACRGEAPHCPPDWAEDMYDSGLSVGLTLRALQFVPGGILPADHEAYIRHLAAAAMLSEPWAVSLLRKIPPSPEWPAAPVGSALLAIEACRRSGMIDDVQRLAALMLPRASGWFDTILLERGFLLLGKGWETEIPGGSTTGAAP